jgi:predicted phage terminase large subunit-like protein
VKLHQVQADFVRSSAPLRAIAGGVGSGKSWSGCYDTIRRGKAGRLYAVVAPTYGMLSDATFRMFVSLAEELGVLDPADVKRSAPPSVKLLTGAEVLFRSADDPDRLRGPNLSGCFLDEASLMPQDAFTVMVGRLREQGERGWLSACFTPKGKRNWTYEVFATGRPDVALFRCRSSDNPFLPSSFVPLLRNQYTSALAAQEVEGEFVELGGSLFRREWFRVVDRPPVPGALAAVVRAWDLAATADAGDYTAGVLMGKDHAGTHYVLDVRRLRGSPGEVEDLVCATAREDGRGTAIYCEQEPGSSGKTVIDHYLRRLAGWNFHGVRSTGSKADRAQPLAALAEGGLVNIVRHAFMREFLDEVELFPFGAHDDMVDAASLGLSKLGWLTPAGGDLGGAVVLTRGYDPSGESWGPFVGGRTGAQGDWRPPGDRSQPPPLGPW